MTPEREPNSSAVERCACGKRVLDRFIVTYSDHEAYHTRALCRPLTAPRDTPERFARAELLDDRSLEDIAGQIERVRPGNELPTWGSAEVWRLLATLDAERARADAATLAGVKAGIEAAHHEAATITVALSGEQVAERREMMARIRAIDADAVAAQVKP